MTLPLPAAPRRLAYLGTPELAVPTLEAIVAAGHDVACVVTRPDARRGRRGEPEPSPVKAAALRLGLHVVHDVDELLAAEVDLGVVVAYGRIIPIRVLDSVPMVNLHFSLLPRWRGAAPVERALLAGDVRTGVCVMDVAERLDEGDVFACREAAITEDDTLGSLRDRLVSLGTALVLDGLADGFGPPVAQVGDPVYAEKITTEDRRLDFATDDATVRRVVALGGAWTTFRGRRLKVWKVRVAPADVADSDVPGVEPGTVLAAEVAHGHPRVATARGWVELVEVQPEGKSRMDASAWANGAHLTGADRLGA
jgi:methionyl-tRNA formyltransferase